METEFLRTSMPGGEPAGGARRAGRRRSRKVLGAATALAAAGIAFVAAVPAAHATSTTGYAIAIQNSAGHLLTITPDGTSHEDGFSMAPGTSPGISAFHGPQFGFAETFVRGDNGGLLLVDPVTGHLLFTAHVAAGSSPTMALKPPP